MLTIRFSRGGKKKKPFYRIIISEKHKDTQNKYLELLGHYNPHTKQAVFKTDRIRYWVQQGATVSNSVFNLLVSHDILESDTKRRSVFISVKRAKKLDDKKKGKEAGAKKEARSKKEDVVTDVPDKKKEGAGGAVPDTIGKADKKEAESKSKDDT